MRTLLIAAVALNFSPAAASDWCPIQLGRDHSSIPAGSHVEVGRDALTLFEGSKRIDCTPQGHDANGHASDFSCAAWALGIPCPSVAEGCVIDVAFAPSNNPQTTMAIELNEFDLLRPDITKFDLWLRPAYDIRSQAFHLCGPDDATM